MIRARRLRARSARCSWSSGGRTHSFTLCGCLNLRGNVPCVRSLYTCPGATQVLRNADAEWSKKNGEQVEPFYEVNSVSRTNVSITWPCETVYCVLVSSLLKDKCNRASVLKKVHIKYGKEGKKGAAEHEAQDGETWAAGTCVAAYYRQLGVSVWTRERQKGNTHRCAPGINQSRGRYQTHKVSLWPAEVQLDLRLNL